MKHWQVHWQMFVGFVLTTQTGLLFDLVDLCCVSPRPKERDCSRRYDLQRQERGVRESSRPVASFRPVYSQLNLQG